MATITNRSNYVVTVEGKPEHTQRFPFNRSKEAQRYLREQKKLQEEAGRNPDTAQLVQLDDNIFVRIRQTGYPEHSCTMASYVEAENEVLRVTADRTQGKRVDYNKARRVKLAFLMHKYYNEECPKHKGCVTERYTLGAFLTDINYQPFIEAHPLCQASCRL